jgi:hypothetical protein
VLDGTTTGTGLLSARTDGEIAAVRVVGGMGFRPGDAPRPLVRLEDVLDRLAGYRGIVIVDCTDVREGAHRALAQLLAARGMYVWVIARTQAGAAEVKSVSERFRTITQELQTFDPNVDDWLASATIEVDPRRTVVADLFGDVGMFVPSEHWGQDERPLLDNGRRWGISYVITNDIAAALAWRSGN